jgi:hypothetical protein
MYVSGLCLLCMLVSDCFLLRLPPSIRQSLRLASKKAKSPRCPSCGDCGYSNAPHPKRTKHSEPSSPDREVQQPLDATVIISPLPTAVDATVVFTPINYSPAPPNIVVSEAELRRLEDDMNAVTAHFPDCDCSECFCDEEATIRFSCDEDVVDSNNKSSPILLYSDDEVEMDWSPIVKSLLPAFQAVSVY